MKIGQYEFGKVCDITPERAEDASFLEFMPQFRYENKKYLPLNNYGKGPFCKFKVTNDLNLSGVYAISVDGVVKYIGECQNLSTRYNMGYGNISPRNCFVGGQETNCRINSLILRDAKCHKRMSLWFLKTGNYKNVEQELRLRLEPEWNRI